MNVLLIDDDTELAEAMAPVLLQYGISLDAAATPSEGLKTLRSGNYDALLLDMMLPEMDGLDVCREIRLSQEEIAGVPIIALTARTNLTDKVVGLESGLDDYISKPFEPRELIARLHSILRRFRDEPQVAAATSWQVLRIALDDDVIELAPTEQRASINGIYLTLTNAEFRMLCELGAAIGETIGREELLTRLNYDTMSEPRVADVIVYRIRNKLRSAGAKNDFIRTVRGRGYTLTGRKI